VSVCHTLSSLVPIYPAIKIVKPDTLEVTGQKSQLPKSQLPIIQIGQNNLERIGLIQGISFIQDPFICVWSEKFINHAARKWPTWQAPSMSLCVQ
jgi:hypothetical protein